MMQEKIGVVGATGDLGGQLCIQLLKTGHKVAAFSRQPQPLITAKTGADLLPTTTNPNQKISWLSIPELFYTCSIIHWCGPIDSLAAKALPETANKPLIILHDSVMANSQKVAQQIRQSKYAVGIVHFLMNQDAMVVINSKSDNIETLERHIAQLGMAQTTLSTQEHDVVMAHSQAPFAILCKLLIPLLDDYAKRGLLTASGEALRHALEDRSARWTRATFETILSNPELPQLLNDMRQMIHYSHTKH